MATESRIEIRVSGFMDHGRDLCFPIGCRLAVEDDEGGVLVGGTREHAIVALDDGRMYVDQWGTVYPPGFAFLPGSVADNDADLSAIEHLCNAVYSLDILMLCTDGDKKIKAMHRDLSERLRKLCDQQWARPAEAVEGGVA